jgi:hypothetical protein
VRKAHHQRREPGEQPPVRRHSEPPEHEDQQCGDADLDTERQHVGAPRGPGQEELQRARLELLLRVDGSPMRRQEPLTAVDEVDQVAGVRTAVERRQPGGGAKNG